MSLSHQQTWCRGYGGAISQSKKRGLHFLSWLHGYKAVKVITRATHEVTIKPIMQLILSEQHKT